MNQIKDDIVHRPPDKREIRVYLGCGSNQHSIDIKLVGFKVQGYNEQDIKLMKIDPKYISTIEIGPRTVLEMFDGPHLHGKKRMIINSSFSNVRKYDIGCFEDHNIWQGNIRSFRIWSYPHYYKIHNTKFCNADSDCRWDHYCLCPNGYKQPDWCPTKKRMCIHMSKYLQSKRPEIYPGDLIDINCLNKNIANKPYVGFNDIKNYATLCMTKRNNILVEGFTGVINKSSTFIFIILLTIAFIIIIFYIRKNY